MICNIDFKCASELNAGKTIYKGVFGFNIQFEFEKDKILW